MSSERDVVERILASAERGFELDAEVLAGDDERIERIERALHKRQVVRAPLWRRQLPLAIAAGMLLAGVAMAALRGVGPAEKTTPPRRVLPSVAPAQLPSALPDVAASPTSQVSSVSPAATPAAATPPAQLAAKPSGREAPPALAASVAASPEPAAVAHFEDVAPSTTAAELFAAANRARVSGNLGQAMVLSEQLEALFPRSAEALTTRLSLGMLHLQRGQAERALEEFRAYEAQGRGATLAEALWGEAQALQKLGRAREERAVLERLLAGYPQSAYVAAARKRLANLP